MLFLVIRGLDPRIHAEIGHDYNVPVGSGARTIGMDCRVKPGNDAW